MDPRERTQVAAKELTPESVKYLVVHCSDTYARMTKVDAREIDRWHRQRGFLRIGYHIVIKRDGTVQSAPDCRPLSMIGAHVEGYNDRSLGICMVGGRGDDDQPEDNFTLDQYHALALVLKGLLQKYPKAEIVGHCELNPHKACPSFDVKKWWHETVAAPSVS